MRTTSNGGVVDASPDGAGELDVFRVANTFIRHRWMFVGLPLVFGALAAGYALLQPRQYSASASFVPNAPSATAGGGLAGLALQLGMNFNTAAPGQTPTFYRDLLTSRDILRSVIAAEYVVPGAEGGTVRGDLVRAFGYAPEGRQAPDKAALDHAMRTLRGSLSAGASFETGIVSVRVVSGSPQLSEQILSRLIRLTQDFDLTKRRTMATARREFAERQLRTAEDRMRAAEQRLESFVAQNRLFYSSPLQLVEHSKLAQELSFRQQVYGGLLQAFEQARLDEVRDTPVITVLEVPEGSAQPEARGTVLRAVLGMALGFVIALMVAAIREMARHARDSQSPEFQEFMELRQDLFGRLRRRGRQVPAGS